MNTRRLKWITIAAVAVSIATALMLAAQSAPEAEQRWWNTVKILAANNMEGRGASPAARALLAEILAIQDTMVGLFCAIERDGHLTPQRVKRIVDASHERKYRDVAPLFRCAHAEIEARRRQEVAKQTLPQMPCP